MHGFLSLSLSLYLSPYGQIEIDVSTSMHNCDRILINMLYTFVSLLFLSIHPYGPY
jgi:hypothetical protein